MGIIQGAFDLSTGGKGNIGAWNRNSMIWKGRAESKRLKARVDALESNQGKIAQQAVQGSGQGGPQQVLEETLDDTLKNINPLNVKNLTVTQIVVSGGSKKDRLQAQKISEKNTKILEQFNRATKEIEKNTKRVHKQNTKIKKMGYKDYAKEGIQKAKKIALKAADKTKGWISNMLETLKSMMPLLVAAALFKLTGMTAKALKFGFRKLGDFARGGSKAELAKKARWAKIQKEIDDRIKAKKLAKAKDVSRLKKKINANKLATKRNTMAIRGIQTALAACCAGGKKRKRKNNRKGNKKNDKKGNKDKSKKSSSKSTKSTKSGTKKATKTVAGKARKSALGKLLKIAGKGALRGLGVVAVLGSFASPILALALGAWGAYDLATWGLVESGVITEEQLEQFETYVWDKLKEYTSKGLHLIGLTKSSEERQNSINHNRAVRYADQYYEIAEEDLEKLKEAYAGKKKPSVIRKHRHKFAKNVKRYNTIVNRDTPNPEEDLKLYLFRHLNETNMFGMELYRTSNEKAAEAKFITAQLELYRRETTRVNEDKIKGTNVKSSSVSTSKKLSSGSGLLASAKEAASKTKDFAKGAAEAVVGYGTDAVTFTLDTPVDGLYPPIWKPLEGMVPAAFRKIIDYIENGNTANYALQGKRSSAFGRYQFMPKTANGMIGMLKDPGVTRQNWKQPIGQDKLFGQLVKMNMKILKGYAGKGVVTDLMSMWIAHNLGAGAVPWMTKKIPNPGKMSKHNIDNQLGRPGKTIEESRDLYLKLYNEKIAKALNAPVGTATPYGDTTGTGSSAGKSGSSNSASGGGGPGGGTYSNPGTNTYGNLPTLAVPKWTGEVDTNIKMTDVISLVGGGARPDAWRMLKPEFKTRILQAASAYKQATGKKLVITSAYRDPRKQAELYAKSKGSGMVAPGGRSMHNWGLAIDLGGNSGVDRGVGNQGDYLFKSGILMKFKLYRPMGNPGHNPYEPWHIEPIETKGHRGAKGQFVSLTQGATTTMSPANYSQTPASFSPVTTLPNITNVNNPAGGNVTNYTNQYGAPTPTAPTKGGPGMTFSQAAVITPKH